MGRMITGAVLLALYVISIIASRSGQLVDIMLAMGLVLALPGALLLFFGWRAQYGSSSSALAKRSVRELLAIYNRYPSGGATTSSPEALVRVHQIGKALNQAGGMDLMLKVHAAFAERARYYGAPKELEQSWNLIGEWRGW